MVEPVTPGEVERKALIEWTLYGAYLFSLLTHISTIFDDGIDDTRSIAGYLQDDLVGEQTFLHAQHLV